MPKKYLSRTSNQLVRSIETDMTTKELKTVKGDGKDHSKHIERVAASPHTYSNVIVPPSSVSPLSTNEQNKVCSVENQSSIASVLSTPIRKHKHKHHHHHNGKHCHHHHHHHRTKTVVRQYKILSPSKAIVKKSPQIESSPNVRLKIDDQQAPLVAHRDTNVQQPIVNGDISQPVLLNQDRERKTNKGNIPLQPIENKLVSQRAAPASETQVDNCPSCFNTGAIQNFPQTLCENNVCQLPPPTTSCVCCPQQQQLLICAEPNIPNIPNNLICSVSNNNLIQQAAFPQQQQLVCMNSTPSTAIQPTFINQTPILNHLPSQIQSQPAQYLRISSATPQIIQTVQARPTQHIQPQFIRAPFIQPVRPQFIQAPPIQSVQPQFIQAPAIQHVQPQFIQAPPIQSVQPQFIQTPAIQHVQPQFIQAPAIQSVQPQFIQAPAIQHVQPQFIQAPPIQSVQPQFIQAPAIQHVQPQFIQAPPIQSVQPQFIQAPAIQSVQPQFIQAAAPQPIQLQCIQAPAPQPVQLQCIQAPAPQPIQLQCIQAPAPQPIQLQCIQAPASQPVQLQCIQAPAIQASPQVLYQRPYDPVILQAPNQQVAITNNPFAALSQPSYAPARAVSAVPTRYSQPGPMMFRNALIRNVANRTGVPVLAPTPGGVQVLHPPFASQPRIGPLGSTARGPVSPVVAPNCSIM